MDSKGIAGQPLERSVRRGRFSIKGLTFGVLGTIALCSTLIALVAGEYFYHSALQAQFSSINRILEIEADEAIQQTHQAGTLLGQNLAQNPSLLEAFGHTLAGRDTKGLEQLLDEPFVTGIAGPSQIELVRLRAYTINLQLVAESHHGISGFARMMPDELRQQAAGRNRIERVKIVGTLWHSHALHQSFYSVLLPLGGLNTVGYLEVVLDPRTNLQALSEKLHMPLRIRGGVDQQLLSEPDTTVDGLLAVNYTLPSADGSPAFYLTGYEDISQLSQQMRQIQYTTVAGFLALGAVALLMAIAVFQRYLFSPVGSLLVQIRTLAKGERSRMINPRGLSEVAELSDAFNQMKRQVQERTDELNRLSQEDPLTGIGNRRQFDTVIATHYRKSLREQRPLTLLLIDVDFFKLYNDNYGHQAGDVCLQAIASALHDCASRPGDIAVRYGGEEFAMVLPDTPYKGLHTVAHNIHEALAALGIPHKGSPTGQITVSIGGATLIPHDGTEIATLIREADRALYQAKESGRNKLVAFELNRLHSVRQHIA